MAVVNFCLDLGYEVDVLHLGKEYLWLGFCQNVLVGIPSASFEVQTIDVSSIAWWTVHVYLFVVRDDLKVPVNLVNGNHVPSGIVLPDTGEETLCKEEATDPE